MLRNTSNVISIKQQVLTHGLTGRFNNEHNDDDDNNNNNNNNDDLLIGGYYAFLNGRETTTPSDDDEIGRIQRWICRAIETGTLADRIREAVENVTFFYEKHALIALEKNQNRILSALEMLNAVIVPVFWTSDSAAARRHRTAQKKKRQAEARKQKRRRKSSNAENSNASRRKASSMIGGTFTGVFHSTGLGSLIGVDSPSRVPRFRSEDTRAKYLDHDYPLTASITGVHQIGTHWQYEVTVRCVQTGESWTVSRRFSYFVNLYVSIYYSICTYSIYNTSSRRYEELKRKHRGLRVKAPDKATLSTLIMRKGKKYGRFVEKRRKKLNEFLQALLDSPHTCDDELFRDFLSPDEMISDEEDGFDTSDEDVLDTFFSEESNLSTPVPTVTTPRSRPRVGARDVVSDGEEEEDVKRKSEEHTKEDEEEKVSSA